MKENDKKELLKALKDYMLADVKREIFKGIAEDMKKPKVIFKIFWPIGIIIIAWIVISVLLFIY